MDQNLDVLRLNVRPLPGICCCNCLLNNHFKNSFRSLLSVLILLVKATLQCLQNHR